MSKKQDTIDFLEELRARLGPNGENWSKGFIGPNEGKCLVHHMLDIQSADPKKYNKVSVSALNTLTRVTGMTFLSMFNDAPETTFPMVLAAIMAAETEVRLDET